MTTSKTIFTARDDATYLGSSNSLDVYTSFDGGTVLIQFGNEDHEYKAMSWSFVPELAKRDRDYSAALRIAIDGYCFEAGTVTLRAA